MRFSIAIPTWESYGRGGEFLEDLLRTIEIQTLKDFEVCISDHSENNDVFDVVKTFKDKFSIVYSRNSEKRGNGPANTNKAIDMCSGDIIKVMFQDDFFYDDESLEKINNEFNTTDKTWLVNGCNHTQNDGHSFYWEMYPKWNDRLLEGVNTISSPSVLAFKNKVVNRFDETLVYFMDCEFYYGMNNNYGLPIFLNDVLVSNRIGEYSVTTNVSHKNRDYYVSKETKYCREKYGL
jgi:glycosyltransferase involved in cell wall biosynthesis